MQKVTFENSAKKYILEAFDKTTDTEGYIVEENDLSQRVLAPNGEEIKEEEFAGIKKGSEVYIKSDLISLIKLADDLSGKDGLS